MSDTAQNLQQDTEENDMETSVVINNDIVSAINRLLLNVPYAEFSDAEGCLRSLLQDSPNLSESIKQVKKKWYLNNYVAVKIEDKDVLLCEQASLGDNCFINPFKGNTFKYDFLNEKIIEEEESKAVEQSELCVSLMKALPEFVAKRTSDGCFGVYDSDDGSVNIVIKSSTVVKQSFKTGLSITAVRCLDGKLEGSLLLNAHYYENGNCLGSFCHNFSDTYTNASEIIEKMHKNHDNVFKRIDSCFHELTSEGLNRLKRKLPVTGEKLKWEQELIKAMSDDQ